MIHKFELKPPVVEAIQWTGENTQEIYDFIKSRLRSDLAVDEFFEQLKSAGVIGNFGKTQTKFARQSLQMEIGDWIVMGSHGEIYPEDRHVFDKCYRLIKEKKKRVMFNLSCSCGYENSSVSITKDLIINCGKCGYPLDKTTEEIDDSFVEDNCTMLGWNE